MVDDRFSTMTGTMGDSHVSSRISSGEPSMVFRSLLLLFLISGWNAKASSQDLKSLSLSLSAAGASVNPVYDTLLEGYGKQIGLDVVTRSVRA